MAQLTLRPVQRNRVLHSFIFPGMKGDRECIQLLRDPGNFGGKVIKEEPVLMSPCRYGQRMRLEGVCKATCRATALETSLVFPRGKYWAYPACACEHIQIYPVWPWRSDALWMVLWLHISHWLTCLQWWWGGKITWSLSWISCDVSNPT